MIVRFLVYATATGAIHRNGTAPEEMLAIQAGAGETVLQVDDVYSDDVYYVDIAADPPAIAARIALPGPSATNVTVGQVVAWSPVPGGTEVIVTGAGEDQWTHDAGDVEIAFSAPGSYSVRLAAQVPYKSREDVIHASA